MALPFATSQMVRYLTDKVLQNVSRQIQQRAAPSTSVSQEALPPSISPQALVQAVGQINVGLMRLSEDVESLRKELSALDGRITRVEKRWGWRSLLRVVLIVGLAFLLGFAFAQLVRLGGWH